MPLVREVLDVLAVAGVVLADLGSEEAQRVQPVGVTVGAVVRPGAGASGEAVELEWYVAGRTGESGMQSRAVPAVREQRNTALEECLGLLRGVGLLVRRVESERTRTRRLESLVVSGRVVRLVGDVARVLAGLGLSRVGVLPTYSERESAYRVLGGHAQEETLALLAFSNAVPVEQVRAAVVALRSDGFDARESSQAQLGMGYMVDVRIGGRPAERPDGQRADTAAVKAARDLLWHGGFSVENTEYGTVGHRVYPQLPEHLRDGTVNVDNTPADVLTALHDRVSVTAPARAYVEGRGQEVAEELSAAHEELFRAAAWTVVREDSITLTVMPPYTVGAVAVDGPEYAELRSPAREECGKLCGWVEVAKASPLVGVAVRLVCACGSAHLVKAVDGVPTGAGLPVAVVAKKVRGEGYEVAGGWTAHRVGGEWPHTVYRAPVVPSVPTPAVDTAAGESITQRGPGWWVVAVDGQVYTLHRRPGKLWVAADSRWKPVMQSERFGEVMAKLRVDAAQHGAAGVARGLAAFALRSGEHEAVGEHSEGFEVYTDHGVDGRWTGAVWVIHTRGDGRVTTVPADEARAEYRATLLAAGWTERPQAGSETGPLVPPPSVMETRG